MPEHQVTLISPTGRLKLIPPNKDDDEAVAGLRSHHITRQFLRYLPEKVSVDEARIRREKLAEDERWMSFHVHLQNCDGTTKFVGMTSLHDINQPNDSCYIGILISPDHHRGGIATEALYTLLRFAFEDKKFHRVEFETGADNIMMVVRQHCLYLSFTMLNICRGG
jgi:RimJ/RimL family protein N-acetyltransferase